MIKKMWDKIVGAALVHWDLYCADDLVAISILILLIVLSFL